MIPFTLPPPNPPHRPPKETGSVAIWHKDQGLIRGWRNACGARWIQFEGSIATRIPDEAVLGWWPDPAPLPDTGCECHGCGATMSVPTAPDPSSGVPRPALDAAPEGWRHTVVRKGVLIPFTGWSCPACPLPENPND
jgi:hypothetical protein